MSKIKERIIQLIDSLDIKRDIFFKKIGMAASSFRSSAQKTPLNSDAIANILSEIPQVNPDWLLTGQGSMLRTITPEELPYTVPPPPSDDIITLLKEQLKEERLKVEKQAQEIGMLKSDNRKLMEQVMGLDVSERKSSISPSQSPPKDAPSVTAHL